MVIIKVQIKSEKNAELLALTIYEPYRLHIERDKTSLHEF